MSGENAHAFMSASASPSWIRCSLAPYLSMLASGEIPDAEAEEYTTEGTAAHQVLESVVKGESRSEMDQEQLEQLEHALDALAFFQQWSGATTDKVQSEIRIDYSHVVPGGFGTCDLHAITVAPTGTSLWLADYKYGQGVMVNAENNPQLYLYALGLLDHVSMFEEIGTVNIAVLQPRLNNYQTVSISAERLIAWGDYVARPAAYAVLNNPQPNPTVEGCQFCSGAGMCAELHNYSMMGTALPETLIEDAETTVERFIADREHLGKFLSRQTLVNKLIDRAKQRGMELLMAGEDVPHVKLVAGSGRRVWNDEKKASSALGRAGVAAADRFEKKLISVAKAEKIIGKDHAAITKHSSKNPGKPTIAPITDKRDSVVLTNAEALDQFNDETETEI